MKTRHMPMSSSRSPSNQKGFTLFELAIVVIVIGLILTFTDMRNIIGISNRSYQTRQEFNNKNIAAALLQYAKTSTPLGNPPDAYTGSGYNNAVFDPTDTALAAVFRSANMAPSEINNDGTTGQRLRVYQRLELSQSIPLDFQSGPAVNLTYHYGEIHQTACIKSDTTCNKTTPLIPGTSVAMTASNYATWTTTGTDLKPEFFSSLPLQKQMLALTSQRITETRDKLTDYFRTKLISATAGDTTNFYPYPYAAGIPGTPSPNMGGAPAATNQYCYDGWYNLKAAGINVLQQIGLTQTQYGSTAWGGQIEYCRDYDPALGGANTQPHYAAFRFNINASTGAAPDGFVSANNVFITF